MTPPVTRRLLTFAFFSPMLIATACREATSIELEITTDLACEEAKPVTTSIRVGTLDDYATRAPRAVTTRCDAATGRIGSLVILPDDDPHAEVAIKIVTAAHGQLPEACDDRLDESCIVATRVVGFVPFRSLTLPVHMQSSCAGRACGPFETCIDGACESARVDVERARPAHEDEPDDAGAAEASLEDAAVTPTPSPTPPILDAGPAAPNDAGSVVSLPRDDDPRDADPRDAGTKKGGKEKEPKGKKKGPGKNKDDERDR